MRPTSIRKKEHLHASRHIGPNGIAPLLPSINQLDWARCFIPLWWCDCPRCWPASRSKSLRYLLSASIIQGQDSRRKQSQVAEKQIAGISFSIPTPARIAAAAPWLNISRCSSSAGQPQQHAANQGAVAEAQTRHGRATFSKIVTDVLLELVLHNLLAAAIGGRQGEPKWALTACIWGAETGPWGRVAQKGGQSPRS